MGLDIGTTTVKFVQLKGAGHLTKLVGYSKIVVPDDYIIEGIISEPEKLASLLRKTFSKPNWGKITAERVIASLPESRVFTRVLELPSIAENDIKDAVKYEVEQSIPIPESDLYIDWQPIEVTDEKTIVFLAAAPRAMVDSYLQLFDSLKIEPAALEISMASIARSMVSNKSAKEPVIILDIGGTTTNIAVFDSTIRITTSHPTGGLTIKNKIMEACGMSEEAAFKVISEGLTSSTKATKILKTEIEAIISEIPSLINYHTNDNSPKITKILICGGLASMPGLTDLIGEKVGINAKIGNPWVNISIYPLKPVPKKEAADYAAAIGLALRGLSND